MVKIKQAARWGFEPQPQTPKAVQDPEFTYQDEASDDFIDSARNIKNQ